MKLSNRVSEPFVAAVAGSTAVGRASVSAGASVVSSVAAGVAVVSEADEACTAGVVKLNPKPSNRVHNKVCFMVCVIVFWMVVSTLKTHRLPVLDLVECDFFVFPYSWRQRNGRPYARLSPSCG